MMGCCCFVTVLLLGDVEMLVYGVIFGVKRVHYIFFWLNKVGDEVVIGINVEDLINSTVEIICGETCEWEVEEIVW